jgi:hypothetical protein
MGLEQMEVNGDSFQDLAELSTLTTVQHALQAHAELQSVHSQAAYEAGVWSFWFKRNPLMRQRDYALDHLTTLIAALPPAWVTACQSAVGPAALGPSPAVVFSQQLLPRLGWPSGLRRGRFVTLTALTVKEATALQLGPLHHARATKFISFLTLACQDRLVRDPLPSVEELLKLLGRLWQVPWENTRKEFFWRLCLDGIPTASRMHLVGESCACGFLAPDRDHHYWQCPVAEAVLQELRRNLGGVALRRVHVWLARSPTSTLHRQLWLVVCQAALLAMDKGRRVLTAIRLGSDAAPAGAPTLPLDLQLVLARKVAVVSFWDLLQDFIGLRLCPQAWMQQVPAQHPFLGAQVHPDGSRSLVLHRA